MPRAERVIQLLDLLRARGEVSTEHLAEVMGVSRRTVFRDLASLRQLGWPVDSDVGPGGGVRLVRQRGLATVHLAVDEVVALWVAAQLSASLASLPWSAPARSALNKVLASLPEQRARELRRLLRRVLVGRPATARVQAELGAPPGELLAAFERGFTANLCLGFDYRDRRGRRTRRQVEPHGLLLEAPAWYILARDVGSDNARLFRMDRVSRCRVLRRTFEPDFEAVKSRALD